MFRSYTLVPVNVTLSGNRVFEDIIQLRWHHIGLKWVQNPTSGVIIRRPWEDPGTQRHTGRRQPGEDEGRDGSEPPISQGTPTMTINHQKLERSIEEHSLSNTLVLDSGFQNQKRIKPLLFEHQVCNTLLW